MRTLEHFPILHFTTELGARIVGGVGTCLNELKAATHPSFGFVHLSRRSEPPGVEGNTLYAGYYDIDVLQSLSFDTAVFHHYGLAYLADDSFLRGRKLIFAVHSVPTTEPWTMEHPYGARGDIARCFETCCQRADAIVCVSEAEMGKLLLLYPDLAERTAVIPNGLSSIPSVRKPIAEERRRFGFLGRADYRKGLLELAAGFRNIPGTLDIACGDEDPAYVSAVRNDAEQRSVGARLRWRGRLPASEVPAFLGGLDALVVPSRWEPFGYVALEALRCGVPPIVSRQGGLPELTGPEYRYQFDPYDRESLANTLFLFQNDPAETARQQLEAAVKRSESLTAERMAAQYARLAGDIRPHPRAWGRTPLGRRCAGGDRTPLRPLPGHASETPLLRRHE